MAQNVSSVRVQIQGDARGLNAELIKAAKAVTDFGARTGNRAVKGLNSQLSQVQRQITEVAEAYVTGGKVQQAELQKLIKLEERLKRQIDARNTAISAARGDFTPLGTVVESPGAAVRPIRRLNNELSTTSGRSGRASLAITQLGFAAEDAAVSFGNQGLAGSLRAAGNNISFVLAMFSPVAGVIGGVGLALSALLIPKLSKATEEVENLAESFDDARRSIANTLLGIRSSIEGVSLEGINVEPVVPQELNRFEAQRREFERLISLERQAQVQAERFANVRANLFDDRFFSDEDLPSGSTLEGLEQQRSIEQERRRFIESAEARIRRAFAEGVETGDASRILETQGDILRELRLEGGPFGLRVDEFKTQLKEQVSALIELSGEAIVARKNIDALTKAENQRAENQAAAERLRRRGTTFGGLAPIGSALSSVADSIFGNIEEEQRKRREALAQADPLQAGFQFGSVEAISAINRATFARPDPVEKDIEKNTSETVDAVQDLITETKNLGKGIASAIGGAIQAGSPL